jgi:ABC-type Fe3+/spermidine/putrescine transport system ATPase subunit
VHSVKGDQVVADLGVGKVRTARRELDVYPGQEITISIRSEKLSLAAKAPKEKSSQGLPASFVEQVYLGLTTHYIVRLADGRQITTRQIGERMRNAFVPGAALYLVWNATDGLLHAT